MKLLTLVLQRQRLILSRTPRRRSTFFVASTVSSSNDSRLHLCDDSAVDHPHRPQQQIRHFSSSSPQQIKTKTNKSSGHANNVKQAMAARDTRLAGRQRFYRDVSVVKIENENDSSDGSDIGTVDSPISAGVDGTASASGIHHHPSSSKGTLQQQQQDREKERHARFLIPRPPGQPFSITNDSNNNRNKVEWYGVALDDRCIKTPMGITLQVPSRLLACQIAAEWNAVERYIQPTQMPSMTMACTALDQASHFATQYQEQVLNFVPTDTLCYFADPLGTVDKNDRVLFQRQERAWKRIHDAIEQTVGTPLGKAMGTEAGTQLMMKKGKRGVPHSAEILDYARTFVQSLDAWHLTALHGITHEAKSFWLGWALLMSSSNQSSASSSSSSSTLVSSMFANHHHKDVVAQAVQAARIEEEFQIENWGLVEGGHDYDRLNTSVNLGAARLLCECLAADNGFLVVNT
jgi:ATP synthase mitochondrial F1 complex assembly factor 2